MLKNDYYFLNRLLNILNNNYDKLNSIKNPIIKIKICKIFNFYLEIYYEKIEKNEQEEINIKFIEHIWDFSMSNIIQNAFQDKENYIQALCDASSETLINLLNLINDEKIKIFVSENIEKNIIIFNAIIFIIDIKNFYLLIEIIVNEIKIEQRNLLFECLVNSSKKIFGNKIEKYYNQFFIILRLFLIGINKINKSDLEEIKIIKDIFKSIINNMQNLEHFDLYAKEFLSTINEYIKLQGGINEESILILNKLISNNNIDSFYDFLSIFISNIQNNFSSAQFDNNILFNEIILIIKDIFSNNKDNSNKSEDNNFKINYNLQCALLLTLKLINLRPNIIEEFIDNLIVNCKDIKEEKNIKITQLTLANISLGFINDPDTTFKILNTKNDLQQYSKFDIYINYLIIMNSIFYPNYNFILGKCILLGICGIFTSKTCLYFLNNNKEKKILLIRNSFVLFNNYIIQKRNFIQNLVKKDIQCSFVDSPIYEEDEEIMEDDETLDFNEKVEIIFKENENILNCDEIKLFIETMKNIKLNDIETYNKVISQYLKINDNQLERLYKFKNIKIIYNNKEYFIPRKIVKIKNKMNINN